MKNSILLKRAGFFRELSHGDPQGPSLRLSQQSYASEHETSLLNYLTHGVAYIVSPGPTWDVLDESGPVGTGTVLTDGEWAWPDDLIHYLEKYHVALPDEFVEHAIANHWHVPEVPRSRLLTLRLS